jgi:glycine/D-amino acid oxidase-like deaminating enzyme
LTRDKVLWLNKNIGYADSDSALEAVIQEASDLGVDVLEADISKLIIDESGACKGAQVEGHNVMANKTVLATGAWTRKLLKDSNVKLFEDPRREAAFLRVTAVAVAVLELTAEEFEQLNELKDMPIVVTGGGIITSAFLSEGSLS